MISIGMQTSFSELKSGSASLGLALLFKLIIAPLIAVALVFGYFHPSASVSQIIIFQAATGPRIAGAIIAAEFDLNRRLAALVVGAGTILSVITIPLAYLLIKLGQ